MALTIIGREAEKKLDKLMASNQAEFLALYGRRRVDAVQFARDRTVHQLGVHLPRYQTLELYMAMGGSTQQLLQETDEQLGKQVSFTGATVETAFELLGEGKITAHNELIAQTIRQVQARQTVDVVVLAQLSMSVFSFSYPDPVAAFGIPVLNSGETGFRRAGEVLRQTKSQHESASLD